MLQRFPVSVQFNLFLQKLQFTTLPIIYNGYVGETFFNYVYLDLDLESSQTIKINHNIFAHFRSIS